MCFYHWFSLDHHAYRVEGSLERLTTGNGYATDLRAFASLKVAVFLKWRFDGAAISSNVSLSSSMHKATRLSC